MSLRFPMTPQERAKYPTPQWGDHVLRGVEGRTTARQDVEVVAKPKQDDAA